MKGAVAAMTCAAVDAVASGKLSKGGLGILLTSDEEGPAEHGTEHVVRVLTGRGVRFRSCLVGEPTSAERLGDTAKNGRRGSLTAELTVSGKQGHSAYPHLADNAIHRALAALYELVREDWGRPDREEGFSATNLQVTDLRGGVGAANVIPGEAKALVNVRFSPPDTAEHVRERIEAILRRRLGEHRCDWERPADPYFVSERTNLAQRLSDSIGEVAGLRPRFSTAGGTSDARFLRRMCDELLEFGPLAATLHQHNERIGIDELESTRRIYESLTLKLLA